MAYNRVIVIGNLTKEPELSTTTSGKSVTNITVAVERSYGDGTDFINATLWGNTAEFVCRYFKKGSPILVEGEMRSRKYTDKQDVERIAWYVEGNIARFVGRKQTDNSESEKTIRIESDDDLPF